MTFNRSFNIDLDEMNLLESALRLKLAALVEQRHASCDDEDLSQIDAELKQVRDFLGSIHHQKNWYRPKDGIYVSG